MASFLKSVIYILGLFSCVSGTPESEKLTSSDPTPAAYKTTEYLHILHGRKVGAVVNQASMIEERHLIDTMITLGIDVQKLFAPEHGIRGQQDAGEVIKDGFDNLTGLPVISLYGQNKKPKQEDLQGLDVMVFDLQDVGVRFYTYISTLHYVMEACAEAGLPLIVLDRPNPNGHYIDGPVLDTAYRSFIGMHPVPVVYGMTIGEYAQMINGEGWLHDGIKCALTVITNKGYNHNATYNLPVKPSPNLPNSLAVNLYPTLCFFEGTTLSIGRGTDHPFQLIGHPEFSQFSFMFTPSPNAGSRNPKHNNTPCYGILFEPGKTPYLKALDIGLLARFYNLCQTYETPFFLENNFFDKLAGTKALREQLVGGVLPEDIRASWQDSLESFKKIRSRYLLYP